jgi:hypothetical protein
MGLPRDPRSVIEDVQFLVDSREFPERIARRLGYTSTNLARQLARWGEKDLAAVFDRVTTR